MNWNDPLPINNNTDSRDDITVCIFLFMSKSKPYRSCVKSTSCQRIRSEKGGKRCFHFQHYIYNHFSLFFSYQSPLVIFVVTVKHRCENMWENPTEISKRPGHVALLVLFLLSGITHYYFFQWKLENLRPPLIIAFEMKRIPSRRKKIEGKLLLRQNTILKGKHKQGKIEKKGKSRKGKSLNTSGREDDLNHEHNEPRRKRKRQRIINVFQKHNIIVLWRNSSLLVESDSRGDHDHLFDSFCLFRISLMLHTEHIITSLLS